MVSRRSPLPLFALNVFLAAMIGMLLVTSRAAAQPAIGTTAPGQVTVEMLLANSVSDANSGQYKEVQDAMEEFFGKRNVKEARVLLTAAKKKFPKLPPAEIMLAQMLAAAGQGAMARAELERGVVLTPKDPEFYTLFAKMAVQDGRYTDAELELAKAEALNNEFNENPKRKRNFTLDINSNLALVAEFRGTPENLQSAVTRLNNFLKEDPDNVAGYQRLGVLLFKLDKPNDAFAAFKLADEAGQRTKAKEVLPAEVMMGRLYEEKENRAEAEKLMMTAAKNEANKPDTLLAVAQWAIGAGKIDVARKLADDALKLNPNSADAQIGRGIVARLQSDLKTAEDCFQNAFSASPSNLGAANQLALVLIEQSDKDKQRRALEIAERNYGQAPNNRELAATLGWVYFNLGRYEEAEKKMAAASTGGGVSPDGAYYIAKLYEQRGKVNEAKLVLQQALDAKQPFVHRRDAEALKTRLEQKGQTSSAPSATPGGPTSTPAAAPRTP